MQRGCVSHDVYYKTLGKISAQPHTIVKQICFLNSQVLIVKRIP